MNGDVQLPNTEQQDELRHIKTRQGTDVNFTVKMSYTHFLIIRFLFLFIIYIKDHAILPYCYYADLNDDVKPSYRSMKVYRATVRNCSR